VGAVVGAYFYLATQAFRNLSRYDLCFCPPAAVCYTDRSYDLALSGDDHAPTSFCYFPSRRVDPSSDCCHQNLDVGYGVILLSENVDDRYNDHGDLADALYHRPDQNISVSI
jgi:hypothetical protein